jgi:hypothetical protein
MTVEWGWACSAYNALPDALRQPLEDGQHSVQGMPPV